VRIVLNPNNRTYRTSNLNTTFRLINLFTGDDEDKNIGRTSIFTSPPCVVENSYEISNMSLAPRALIDPHHIMSLIMKKLN